MNAIQRFMLALVILTIPVDVFAATYDICGTIRYWDRRTQHSSGAGGRVNGDNTQGVDVPARDLKIYLFDQDNCNDFTPGCSDTGGNIDDQLGSVYTSSTGTFCFYNVGEDEDIYLYTKFEGSSTQVKTDDDTYWGEKSWMVEDFGSTNAYNPDGGDMTLNWNITCPTKTSGVCQTQGWVNGLWETVASMQQSAADVDYLVNPDSLFYLNGHSSKLTIYYPDSPDGDCDTVPGARSFDCDGICVSNSTSARQIHSVTHEIGHALMKRALNHCDSLSEGGGDCGSHTWASFETDKCATSEGWANFVALATTWYPYGYGWAFNTINNAEGQTNAGSWPVQPRQCVASLTNYYPHMHEGNVARYFWDLYDTSAINDSFAGYSDNQSTSFQYLLQTWDLFPAGTGDRKASESGADGRNVYDYAYWFDQAYSGSAEGEIHVNCLTDQETN